MVDHIRTLIENRDDVPGYAQCSDRAADMALSLVAGGSDRVQGCSMVLARLATAPDMAEFLGLFDRRRSPCDRPYAYETEYGQDTGDALAGMYARAVANGGWWSISGLFAHDDPAVSDVLSRMREAAGSPDAASALGAIVLACAYRRELLQHREDS